MLKHNVLKIAQNGENDGNDKMTPFDKLQVFFFYKTRRNENINNNEIRICVAI